MIIKSLSLPCLSRLHRLQVSVSSNDDLSISQRAKGGMMLRLRRGVRCYFIGTAVAVALLILYTSDLTYITAVANKKVPVRRHVVRWEDHEHEIDHRKPRIMISYWGRMGNHMFEYATMIGVAQRNNMTPIMTKDIDILDVYKIPTPQGDMTLLRNPKKYPDELPAKYFKGTEHLDEGTDAFLEGYYQSWKYFDHIKKDLVTNHFVYHDNIIKAAKEYIANILQERNKEGATLIAIHVRRGDFVRQRVKGYTAAPIPYFYKAMAYFRKKYKNCMFIICTNDLIWSEENLDKGPDVHYSHVTDGALDLAIMTSCDHMIITAGSYSWWAGYLVPGEVIYYGGYPQPNTIIGNLTVKEDYYPPYWKPLW